MAKEDLATGAIGARRMGNRPRSPSDVSDFEFSRHGIPVPAWYTDLNQDDEVFRYAFVVRDVTYGGQASWNDADSNISTHVALTAHKLVRGNLFTLD